MKGFWYASAMTAAFTLGAGAVSGQSCPAVEPLVEDLSGVMAHVRYLADDGLAGREPGTAGERCAGDYIAQRFAAAGLQPAGSDGSWFQSFPVRSGSRLTGRNALAISGEALEVGKGWTPLGFSASTTLAGPLVYAGPGVGLPDAPGGVEPEVLVDGALAVVELETPGTSLSSLQADPHYKASAMARRGAAAVLLLFPDEVALPHLDEERRPTLSVPVLALAGDAADRVRSSARSGATAELTTSVAPAYSDARNVAALLAGSDPARTDEVVIVGAHYDHLGMGGEGSLVPETTAVHNGADDNASGTAALLEAAERLALGPAPARPVLFVAFSGEERGLLGSAHYTDHPTVPLDDAVAMLNLDMVGRLRDNTLTVFGVATAPEWEPLLRRLNTGAEVGPASPTQGERGAAPGAPAPLELALLPDGYGPSDHAEFHAEGIPVLHFFTNTHTEYHRPDDDWNTVNGPGLERVTAFVTAVAGELAGAGAEGAPVPTLTPTETRAPTAAGDGEGSERGYGPYFGSIPDMAGTGDYGLKLSGVREDSPAERAGVRGGDVLVRFGGTEVTDIYAFTYALREARPGDRVEVVVERDGRRLTFQAVLGERR
jgi:Zn-dependent M28 family amino/carboxypeptidase